MRFAAALALALVAAFPARAADLSTIDCVSQKLEMAVRTQIEGDVTRNLAESGKRFQLVDWAETHSGADRIFAGKLTIDGIERSVSGRGNGLMSSVVAALAESGGPLLDIVDYSEHAIGQGSNVQAAAYVECRTADGKSLFGCGLDTDVATASVRAILSAANGA